MSRVKSYAWIIVGGGLLTLAPLLAEEVHIGDHVVTRAEALKSGALYVLGALGGLLLIALTLSIKGNQTGTLLLKWWGAIYSLLLVPLSYAQFGVRSLFLVLVAIAFAALWHHWSGEAINSANG